MKHAEDALDLDAIRQASQRISGVVRQTPLIPSRHLSELLGAPVYLKAEALQRTGSFKLRGAANRLALLTEEQRRHGIVAASAGNHGQAVALVASSMGVQSRVVMPRGASVAKVEATRSYGGEVILEDEPFARAMAMAREENLTLIHPFDDPAIVAGQGTVGLEIVEALPDVTQVVVPTGGGGLAAGVALAVESLRPAARVVGVQSAAAPGVEQSLRQGRPLALKPRPTIADGVAVAGPGEVTFPLLQRYLDDIVIVDEETIAQAIVLLLERSKLVAEGAGALGVAAILECLIPAAPGPTVLIVSGGNIDIHLLARAAEHGLTHAGRYLSITVGLEDSPEQLAGLLAVLAAAGANVLQLEHHRWGVHLPMGRIAANLVLETRDRLHAEEVCSGLEAAGYAPAPATESEASRWFVPRAGWRATSNQRPLL